MSTVFASTFRTQNKDHEKRRFPSFLEGAWSSENALSQITGLASSRHGMRHDMTGDRRWDCLGSPQRRHRSRHALTNSYMPALNLFAIPLMVRTKTFHVMFRLFCNDLRAFGTSTKTRWYQYQNLWCFPCYDFAHKHKTSTKILVLVPKRPKRSRASLATPNAFVGPLSRLGI